MCGCCVVFPARLASDGVRLPCLWESAGTRLDAVRTRYPRVCHDWASRRVVVAAVGSDDDLCEVIQHPRSRYSP